MLTVVEVMGTPQPWKRPGRDGKGRRYDPNKGAKKQIRGYAMVSGLRVHDGPVDLDITAYFRPTGKHQEGDRFLHKRRNDADNLAKNIMDALEGIAYHYDGQVELRAVRRRYGLPERTVIRVYQLDEDATCP